MQKLSKGRVLSAALIASAMLVTGGTSTKTAAAAVDPEVRCDFTVSAVCTVVTYEICIPILGEVKCTTNNDTIYGLRLET
jgi:hypothetical protein